MLSVTLDLEDVINAFASFFRQIYNIGDNIYFYFGSGMFNVTLNTLLIALFSLGLVLSSILVFGKSAFGMVGSRVNSGLRSSGRSNRGSKNKSDSGNPYNKS